MTGGCLKEVNTNTYWTVDERKNFTSYTFPDTDNHTMVEI